MRPDLLFDPQRNNPAGGVGRRHRRRRAVVGVAAGRRGGARCCSLWSFVAFRRHRARLPLSPLDRAVAELEAALRRAGRPLETGTTLRQLEQRLGGSAEATAYLRALSASRYGATPRLPTREERRALRRALAQGLGWGGRLARALGAAAARALTNVNPGWVGRLFLDGVWSVPLAYRH